MIGAVELSEDGRPRRLRLEPLASKESEDVRAFVTHNVARDSTVVTDGLPAYRAPEKHVHQPKTVGRLAAHVLLPWIHRAFANLKQWLMGTLLGVSKPHLKRDLDEVVFPWKRRRDMAAAFDSLLGLAARMDHASERHLILGRV